MALSQKQQRFVDEYLIDLNATESYKRAGYKGKGHAAESAASQLLRNIEVKEAIQVAIKDRSKATEITAENVLRELALIGFCDIGQVMDFSGSEVKLLPANLITEAGRKMLSSMKVKRYVEGHGEAAREVEVTEFKLWDKESALVQLGKHLGLFPNKLDHTGSVGIEIVGIEVIRQPLRIAPESEIPPHGPSSAAQ